MHFVKFHPEVASCLLSRGKRKYLPLGMRLIWKCIRNYFLVYQLISHFLSYLQNYKEYEAKILDSQPEKYGLSFYIKKCTTSGWALGDENVIGIRAFKYLGSYVLDSKKDFLTRKGQAWIACNKLDVIWKSDITRATKIEFFRACVESILLYGAETWTLKKELQDRLDDTYTRLYACPKYVLETTSN